MHIQRLSWLGTRTANYRATADFFADVLGLTLVQEEPGLSIFRLPGGEHDYVEVFDLEETDGIALTSGPVPGFLVDDVFGARAELETAGVELLGPSKWLWDYPGSEEITEYGWFNFRGPDSNVYNCMQGSPAVRV
ncbi:MAG: VOC family protein [Thermoleophilia bacterium]|nr:VOC family protein [Thermoleophilia bacterium]